MTDGTGPVAVVVNPRATRVGPGTLGRVRAALAGHEVAEALETTSAAHTREVVAGLRDAGVGVVVMVGGDGTVASAAAVLAGGAAALLPLPGGSTSVFARGIGWPQDLEACIALLPDALAGPRRTLRLGHVVLDDGPPRVMCVNAGVGIDAEAVRWVEDHPSAKRRLRQGAFVIGAAGPGGRALVGRRGLRVAEDGHPGVAVATVLAACGRPYTYVRSRALDLLPRAAWDGRVEWLGMRRGAPLGAGRTAVRALRGGAHVADPLLVGGLTTGDLHISSGRPVAVQADGEPLGRARHVVIRPGPPLLVAAPGTR